MTLMSLVHRIGGRSSGPRNGVWSMSLKRRRDPPWALQETETASRSSLPVAMKSRLPTQAV